LKNDAVLLGKDWYLPANQCYDGESKGCRIIEEEELLSGQLTL
jgi:hypothetical protein